MSAASSADEVAEDYKNSLEDLTLNSRYEISNLTVIAKENTEHALAISRVLETHIRSAPPARKLPALYVLDSIVKNVGTPYTLFFGRNLYQTYMNAYTLVDGPVRKKLEEMLKTWKEPVPGSLDSRPVFPVDVTRPIETALIKARTAAIQLQQQHAKTQPVRASMPYVNTPTPPNGYRAGDPNIGNQAYPQAQGYTQYQAPSSYGPPPDLSGIRNLVGDAHQPPYHQQYSRPTPSPQPQIQPSAYAPPPESIDALNSDIASLIISAKSEFAANPYDEALRQRLKALLDLQSILTSQALPQEQLRLIKDQVAQLSGEAQMAGRETPSMSMPLYPPPPTQQSESRPQSATPSMFPPGALAALLSSSTAPQPIRSPPPQFALPVAQPPPLLSQLLGSVTGPAVSMPPSGGENPLLASLRAAGMLPPATSSPSGTSAIPAPLPFPFQTPPPQNSNSAFTRPSGPDTMATEIIEDIPFTSASLKISRPHLIAQLYEARPNQCTTCGRRFVATEDGRLMKAKHLDWHFKVNLRMGDAQKRGQNRSWYIEEREWISSKDYEGEDATGTTGDPTASTSKQLAVGRMPKQQWIPVPNDPLINTTCPIDQEKFETVWHDEAQEWVWMDAVMVGGKVYHASCYAEVNGGTPVRDSTPDSVLGKRKAEDNDSFVTRSKMKTEVA